MKAMTQESYVNSKVLRKVLILTRATDHLDLIQLLEGRHAASVHILKLVLTRSLW